MRSEVVTRSLSKIYFWKILYCDDKSQKKMGGSYIDLMTAGNIYVSSTHRNPRDPFSMKWFPPLCLELVAKMNQIRLSRFLRKPFFSIFSWFITFLTLHFFSRIFLWNITIILCFSFDKHFHKPLIYFFINSHFT